MNANFFRGLARKAAAPFINEPAAPQPAINRIAGRSIVMRSACAFLVMCGLAIVGITVMPAARQVLAAEPLSEEPITPVPATVDVDPRKVELGRMLFSDSRLSAGNGVSCASCHFINRGLTDGLPISRGLPGHPGATNALSLFNVGLSSKLTWAGLDISLAEQTKRIVENPSTMGAKWDQVVATLRNDSSLNTAFQQLYREGLQRDTVIDTLVQYQTSLITPNAPFDRFLRGDSQAISPQAQHGYQLFKTYGCVSCHQGVNVGGNMLQVFGIFGTPQAAALGASTPGSAKGSGIDDVRPVFRVPVLRNVQHTAPYFHDGSAATLEAAISVMAQYQLGREISDGDIAALKDFLNSLSGEYNGAPLEDR
ncbi:cytochrome-c peroxidase [Agrobacterium vitis]|uniref:cytochrome-c peroxidase n=1 Tax=Agrobacterium vitis TaxID=373 RepID=UPI0015741A2F|nr:cytochrome c peroxidase [Agrobacterium vitis]NSZ19484.1 c-type cytochrome [Agrobacterium vitis]QZO06798.1 c-type cytochrome [Agrobacterium vitis]UJL91530.1 c-type cytochrome [Agrobacterium vitis]